MPISLLPLLLLLILLSFWVFSRFYQTHLVGKNATEKQVQVTLLDKQAVSAGSAENDEEYWIYVQAGPLGLEREFQVGVHYYHALNIGDKGLLTYKGDRFIHFALKKSER